MKVTQCRLCGGKLSEIDIELPPTPLANEFLTVPQEQDTFPLEICHCLSCSHFQLTESVDPERLFKNYLYVSGHSKQNIEHFSSYAEELCQYLKPGDLVLDIASNDGTLLKEFKKRGMRVLGVDPASNLAEIANKEGIETIPEFFTLELAEKIKLKYGSPKIITCNNVLAHTDTVTEILAGVKHLLDKDGLFTFEVSYFMDVLRNTAFDVLYHEHTS